jgi:membrane-associated phospholipid phosphatase
MISKHNTIAPHPAELATLGILAVVTVTLCLALTSGAALLQPALLHGVLLLGFAALVFLLTRHAQASWAAPLRAVAVIGIMFTLYSTLGHIAFAAIPWRADAALNAADRAVFLGNSPSLLWAGQPQTRTVEFLSFFYAAFIPYLYISILLGLVARPPSEREEFVTAFALLYAFSFLGYLFLPARGPIVELAAQFPGELHGDTFHRLVVRAIDSMGGPHGAFPSLHVGATFLVVWFDLRHHNLLRGLIYIPLLILIAVATIVLRYHWVVDLIAGVSLALLATWLAPMLVLRWQRAALAGAR